MKKADVLKLASMPLQSPTFPKGPYRFFKRQYMILSFAADPAAIRAALPEPLEPAGNQVNVQWLDLPDGEGLGAYSAAAQVIPCTFKGEPCNFIAQMYVDNTSPLAGGREIWGYPMKFGKPSLTTRADTLTGELSYAGQLVATGTMVYKHDHGKIDLADIAEQLKRTQVTLKLIPGVDGKPAIAQLVGVTFEDVDVEGAWSGPGRVELVPSVNCPLADLPPAGAVSGLHILANMTLPYGRVLHDYLA